MGVGVLPNTELASCKNCLLISYCFPTLFFLLPVSNKDQFT